MQKCVCLCVCEYTYLIIKKYKLDNSTPDTGVWPSMTVQKYRCMLYYGHPFFLSRPPPSPLNPNQTSASISATCPHYWSIGLQLACYPASTTHIHLYSYIHTLSRSQMHAYMCTHTFQYNHKITKKLERKKPWECHNFSILFFQMFSAKPRNMDYFVFLKMKNPFIPAPKYLMYIRNFS